MSARSTALQQLITDGVIEESGGAYRPTRRCRLSIARAALQLYASGDRGDDLRFPIALALLGWYGPQMPEEQLAELVEALLPIEEAEMDPGRRRASG
jgi:hypothetical protein